jgi:hypothetical protein
MGSFDDAAGASLHEELLRNFHEAVRARARKKAPARRDALARSALRSRLRVRAG